MEPPIPAGPSSTNPLPAGEADGRKLRLLGAPLRFHASFIILIGLLLVLAVGSSDLGLNLAYIAGLFLSILIHEVAHALVARSYGIRTMEIVLYPIGGVARLEREPQAREEFWIALAGPVINLAIGAAGALFLWRTTGWVAIERLSEPVDLASRLYAANLVIGLFNLLPAFPMDGGRLFRSVVSRFRSPTEATRVASVAGRFLALGLGSYGIIESQFFIVLIALFIYIGAAQESAAAIGRELTQGIPVRSAMITDYRTLSHGNSIRDAAELLISTTQQNFPVVLGEQVIGLLGRRALMRGLAREGPETYVAGVMDRQYTSISPDMDLAEAVGMLSQPGSCALVMQEEKLLGLLTRDNLTEFLMLRRMGLVP